MRLVLKNPTKNGVMGHFRNKDVIFKAKYSKIFDMDKEEEKNEYFYWKDTFNFLYDITANLGGDFK